MRRSRPVVAIDGPAGAGKTTVARGVARALGFALVDTGALYRTVAFAARRRGIERTDGPAMEQLARSLATSGALRLEAAAGEVPRIVLEGAEIGAEIRTPELSMDASIVSAHAGVRAALLELQRHFGADGGVVLEGRDIGTVVFPDAEVKIFLTAGSDDRAERRYLELQAKGQHATLQATRREIDVRDRQDSERAVAPLRPASDAVTIDSSGLTVEQVVDAIVQLTRARAAGP